MNRRDFLATGAAGATAASMARAAAVKTAGAPDVAVIGAGAFGGWASLCLQEQGARVTNIDQYGPASPRASSGDESRALRSSYGTEAFYAAWATQARSRWEQRQAEFGRQILYPSELLVIARGMNADLRAQAQTLRALGVAFEIADHQELRKRYPQMHFRDEEIGFIETNAATLKARESLVLASEFFRRKGGRSITDRAMPGHAAGRTLHDVVLGSGQRISASTFVFACGPWSPATLKPMARKVRVARRELAYFGTPPGDNRFSWPNQPMWADMTNDGYGFANIDRGFKYAPPARFREPHDPDTAERIVHPQTIAQCHEYLAFRFPDLRDAPVLETRVCQVEEPAQGDDFIIDLHPDYDNVWIASAGGGHAFKFGPLLGEYIAGRVARGASDPKVDALFRLSAHKDVATA